MAVSRVVDRVGQVLGGRYRLIAPIGSGASASVYLADDVTLKRRVAVKILHDALADDAAFLRRFRAEAQAAAALNHPHIMAVYDWGHGDVPFLVTEYLGGGSLRHVLDRGRTLSVSQTLLVGLEAARGLDYAHRRGFVHRDIKPANLLFDEDGRLRIADFGLARALAEAAWTEPMGAVLGTARYASPEQARGETLDGRSDVYSLGLVLVEAVTGSVPFSADTTIGTLMGRVERTVPVPDELGALRPALLAAGAPDPADRPDAATFAALLMEAAPDLDRPEPLPLAGAMVVEPDEAADKDPTTQYLPEREVVADLEPPIMLAPPGSTSDGITLLEEGDVQPPTRVVARPAPADTPPKERRRDRRKAKRRAERDARAAARAGVPDWVPAEDLATDTPKARRRRRWPWVLLAVAVLGGAAAGGWAYWYQEIRIPTVALAEVTGRPIAEVQPELEAQGFVVQTTDTRADGTVAGQVLSQEPAPGTHLAEGDVVTLVVSLGPPLVDLPADLVGLPLDEATAAWADAGLSLAAVGEEFSEDVAAGAVIRPVAELPAQLPKGSTVEVVTSAGPAPRTIPPDIVGASQAAATAELEALGLDVAVEGQFDEEVPAGVVLAVRPGEGGQAARGSTVTLTVSRGPRVVPVPDVAGLSAAEAAQQLQAQGFVVTSTQGSPANPVTGTSPAAGTEVRPGTSVVIITG